MEVAKVVVIMGSNSDWETMQHACNVLDELDISNEKEVISAHRTPDDMFRYAETARKRDIKVIIAGAGGAAHLPGMTASKTTLQLSVYRCSLKRLMEWIRFYRLCKCLVVFRRLQWQLEKLEQQLQVCMQRKFCLLMILISQFS